MNHHDAELTEVICVLDGQGQKTIDRSLEQLKNAGLQVSEVKPEEGIVEGTIDASKVHNLKSVEGVCYVRSVFTYTADYPTGDPRDQDGPEASFEDDDD